MGCVQNTLLCMYILTETFSSPEITNPDQPPNYKFSDSTPGWQTLIETSDFMDSVVAANISMARVDSLLKRGHCYYPEYIVEGPKGKYKFKDQIPGKLAASVVFPEFFSWSRNTGTNKKLSLVEIKDGIILPNSGPLCKKIIGGTMGSAIHPLWRESRDLAADVISDLQLMTTVLITRIGFSVGLSDCITNGEVDVQSAIKSALVKCDIINSGQKEQEEKEREINGALNEAMSVAPDLARIGMNKGDRNSLVIMKRSGAKGNDVNIAQISGFLGQQNIDGKRISFMLCDSGRSLPYFGLNDHSPASRGFVSHSFLQGLTPYETWYHAMGGRRGVVDTALKSVTYETEIIISNGGDIVKYKIGEWIDSLLKNATGTIQRYEDRDMELLDISDKDVLITTMDKFGKVSCEQITAVTRHDPGRQLYKITTKGGRSVIVTESKSLLIWDGIQFVQTDTPKVKIGDYMPANPLDHEVGEMVGDVILDGIVNIELVDPALHKKVYDVTVPKTTNFCLANGLHVVDTADSGYVEKKIVNMINDMRIYADETVRDANQAIVQFQYGGDGFSAKELIFCEGLNSPFFTNVKDLAGWLNTEADQTIPENERGVKRPLAMDELNYLCKKLDISVLGEKTRVTERTIFNIRKCLKIVCNSVGVYESMIPKFCRKILDEFEQARAKSGYMAGLVSALSLGEPTTQLTLNSVDWETIIHVRFEKKIGIADNIYTITQIGKLVDYLLDSYPDRIEPHPNETEYLDISDMGAEVTSVDENGKMHWKRLTAVTRHLPGGKLVHVKTRSGREVIATKSKSFLVRCDNKIIPKLGSDIIKGDFLPLVIKTPDVINPLTELDLSEYLPRDVYATNVFFPEKLRLDKLTGFLFGAYLAKGCITKNYISISKNDHNYLKNVSDWCDRYKIGWQINNFVASTNIRIYSVILSTIIEKCCGRYGKYIPSWSMIANLDFVKGLLDGYFSGDGKINKRDGYIVCSSSSVQLLDGISELCSRFGIFGSRGVRGIGSKNIYQVNTYSIRNGFAQLFAKNISLVIDDKQKRLDDILKQKYKQFGGRYDIIPGVNVKGLQGDYHRDILKEYLKGEYGNDKLLKIAVDSDVYFDEIVSVEEVESSHPKVYDFTVEDTRTFTIFGGLCVYDTFHSAGQSAKDVTLGVPRLKEILNATKKPAKPSCTVYLTDPSIQNLMVKKMESRTDDIDSKIMLAVSEIASKLPSISVRDLLVSHELKNVDSNFKGTPIDFVKYEEYKPPWWKEVWEELGGTTNHEPQKWVIILNLNQEIMYKHKITTKMVADAIETGSIGGKGQSLCCVPSPNSISQIEVYINYEEMETYIQEKDGLDDETSLINEKNVDYFVARDVALEIIKNASVAGISNISKTFIRQDYKTEEWIIDTQGTNLQELLGYPGVDSTRTISDDMWEIYYTLGLEATRDFLITEIIKILSFDGTYINKRHVCLLVDAMLRYGTITPVSRDGISRDVGPIAKGLFEKTVENFAESSCFAEMDMMKGVASCIMYGSLAPVGSAIPEIKDGERMPTRRFIK